MQLFDRARSDAATILLVVCRQSEQKACSRKPYDLYRSRRNMVSVPLANCGQPRQYALGYIRLCTEQGSISRIGLPLILTSAEP